jgi:hypothetical protein
MFALVGVGVWNKPSSDGMFALVRAAVAEVVE